MESPSTAAGINRHLLEAKLAELEKARTWSARLISKLEALLNDPDEFTLHRVNPMKFAADKGIEEQEAVDLFLHATKLGIFKMEWHLICPSCGDALESFAALSGVHSHYSCKMCQVDGEAHFDDLIETSFSVSPQVRDCAFHKPENLSIEDFYFRYHYSNGAIAGPGISMAGVLKMNNLALSYLEPGQTKVFEMPLKHGYILGYDLIRDSGWVWAVKAGGSVDGQVLKVSLGEAGYEAPQGELKSGSVSVSIENTLSVRASIMVAQLPSDHFETKAPVTLPRFLTGNRLLNSQTFRNLFRGENIQGNDGIGIRDLTLLFTDLKGSTEMYERIGDLKAFALVQQHFEHLAKAIQGHRGAVVKTIGDAVMASFGSPADALAAALEMLTEIDAFNQAQGSHEIILKIGIHKGASIAVTLNSSLDYFGQTVNIAARVQGAAGAEEICLTEDVYRFPGVAEQLPGLRVQPEMANLKGIRQSMRIYRISERLGIPESPAVKSSSQPVRAAKAAETAKPKFKTKSHPKAQAKSKLKSKPKAKAKLKSKTKSKVAKRKR